MSLLSKTTPRYLQEGSGLYTVSSSLISILEALLFLLKLITVVLSVFIVNLFAHSQFATFVKSF